MIYMDTNDRRITVMTENDSEYVTVREASVISGRTVPSIYRWMKLGKLTRYKTGTGRTLIKRAELDALLAPHPMGS